MKRIEITCALVFVLGATTASAQYVPEMINYQGRLTDNSIDQVPIDATLPMTFSIWTTQTVGTGTQLWQEHWASVQVDGGIFSVLLGSQGSPLGATDFFDGDRYLQIEVDGDILSPRQQLGSVGWALEADRLDGFEASEFAASAHGHSGGDIGSGTVAATYVDQAIARDSEIMPTVLANDGSGSTLDADTVDGIDSSALGGLVLPYSGSSFGTYAFSVANDTSNSYSQAHAIYGRTRAGGGRALEAWASSTAGPSYGLYARNFSNIGTAIFGLTSATSGTPTAIHGKTTNSVGQAGFFEGNVAIETAGFGAALEITRTTTGNVGPGLLVTNSTPGGNAITASTDATTGGGIGLAVSSNSADGSAIVATALGSGEPYGIYASASPSGWAGYFNGKTAVADNLWVYGDAYVSGIVSKAGGAFRIDHPQDPENKTLSHSFVESPEMMNIYNGNVRLGAGGEAEVELPSYFMSLNENFRYQLTPIGAAAPTLHVSRRIVDGRFRIAGGTPGLEVSWQVTGTRKDPWALQNPIVVEQEKPEDERGAYLQPEVYEASH